MKIDRKIIKKDIKDEIRELKIEVKKIRKQIINNADKKYLKFVKIYLVGYIHWLRAVLTHKDCGDIQKYWIIDNSNKKIFLRVFYILHNRAINCGDVECDDWHKFLNNNYFKINEKIKNENKK